MGLKDANLTPDQISYINTHGTSTNANDTTETAEIKQAIGDNSYQVAISSTKSMTGHLLGGSGGIEAVAAVMAIANDQVPPTINLDNPDEGCDLDLISHTSRKLTVDVAFPTPLYLWS